MLKKLFNIKPGEGVPTLILFIYFFAFVALPTIAKTDNMTKERITLSLIPRFSGLFIIAIGILIITGPTLLWFLDDNVGSLTESTYGKLILLKIGIAAAMILSLIHI